VLLSLLTGAQAIILLIVLVTATFFGAEKLGVLRGNRKYRFRRQKSN
jgi:hypothetical protein